MLLFFNLSFILLLGFSLPGTTDENYRYSVVQ